MHTIVGLTGFKRSGKDTAARIISARYKFQSAAFAAWLKDVCRGVFMLSHEQLHGDNDIKEAVDPRWNASPRTLMQVVGTELFRDALTKALPQLAIPEGSTIWCKCMRMWIESFTTPHSFVISDVRFPDEAKMIRELGGVVVRIERPGDHKDTHASETAQQEIVPDHTLRNDGTLKDFERAVVTLMDTIVRPAGFTLKRKAVRGLDLNEMPRSVEDLAHGTPVMAFVSKRAKPA